MRTGRTQQGMVLVISLLMLVVMSLLAVSVISTSNTNLLIVNNVQQQQRTEAAAQRAIEAALSSIDTFNTPAAAELTIDGVDVDVTAAECLARTPATGYSAVWNLAPEDTSWELRASAQDAASGARATMTQGVEARLVAGSCPPPAGS